MKRKHAHAGAGAFGESGHEFAADVVVSDDVMLEEDDALRSRDRLQPRREIFVGVLQYMDGIAGNERRTGRTRKSLLGENAQRSRNRAPGRQIRHCCYRPRGL